MMVKPLVQAGVGLFLAILLAACQDRGDTTEGGPSPDASPAETETGGEMTEGNAMTENDPDRLGLEEAVEAARKDMAGRTGVAPEEIEVARAQTVTWSNGALGCPEGDMMYTQALVDGYFILLRAGGEEAAYHAGRDGKPFHCPAERSKAPPRSAEGNPTS